MSAKNEKKPADQKGGVDLKVDGTPRKKTQGFVVEKNKDGEEEDQVEEQLEKNETKSPKGKETKTPLQFEEKTKPVLTKAERRAIQEKQRAEKQQRLIAEGKLPAVPKSGPPKESINSVPILDPQLTPATSTQSKKQPKSQVIHRTETQKQVSLFSHLPQYEQETSFTANLKSGKHYIHPAVIQLGLQFQKSEGNTISGGNARCVGMLLAFKKVISDYETPADQVLSRHLTVYLGPHIQYLSSIRHPATSMSNAIRYLKKQISTISPETPEREAKDFLLDLIDGYIRERIIYADELIVSNGISKIRDGDVILTYACSSVVEKIFVAAHTKGTKFRVIVVDGRPHLEGKALLSRLVKHGLQCSYVLINAISYVMKEVSKVFVGAHCMFNNGTFLSRVGTAMVAAAAYSINVPLIVCCQSHKFADKVQLDSFVFNELGNPDDLVSIDPVGEEILTDWRDIPQLKLLNLSYDVTPKEYVSLVITEVGMIPCTSVPVVLREYLP